MENSVQSSDPTAIVVFGATGDLALRKIYPSLFHLYRHGRLPDPVTIIGFSRRELSDEAFRDLVREAVAKKVDAGHDIEAFLAHFYYRQGTFGDVAAFRRLAVYISEREGVWQQPVRKLFYLAVPPEVYATIFSSLAKAGLNAPGTAGAWSRVLIEKPFGSDLKSAQQLQGLIATYFDEEQLYRIDHYLFKEIVQGIGHFRFSNNLFEHTWGRDTVERIDIRLLESLGVEQRGAFYEKVGALRDVGQNHLLVMLAAVVAAYTAESSPEEVQKARAQVLKALRPWSAEPLRTKTYRAQYAGYNVIAGVVPESKTETYFALETELTLPEWRGTPVFLEAGKRTGAPVKEIVITLKHSLRCSLCEVGAHGPNTITFRLEPNDEIVIKFWTKKPGFDGVLEERAFSFFLYEKETKSQYVEEYAKVLNAAMRGDRALFVSPQEIEAMWQFVDPVVKTWQDGLVPLAAYEPDTRPATPVCMLQNNVTESSPTALGIIGLGKMGAGIALQLLHHSWRVVGYNDASEVTKALRAKGIEEAYTLAELVAKLETPRTVWLMVPYGAVDSVLRDLVPLLASGDTVIDGGNSFYKDSVTRAHELAQRGIAFLDVGVSGGPSGARSGACLMVGGTREAYLQHTHLFSDLASDHGATHVGSVGAGHFVKMVHNGIEYGMLQAIAEGFAVLQKSAFNLDVRSIADLYNHGSVITSRLMGWLGESFARFGPDLDTNECCSPVVGHSGEGQWTVDTARALGVKVPVIEAALQYRLASVSHKSYTGRVLSAMRYAFGGHTTKTAPVPLTPRERV